MSEPSALRLSPRSYRATARVRGVSHRLGIPLLFGGLALSWTARGAVPDAVLTTMVLAGVAMLMAGLPALLAHLEAPAPPRAIELPVRGRWQIVNSPASAVPSHGTNGYGQTYGFDLVYDPPRDGRPEPAGLGFDRPERFPAFGQPVLAPADGVVVSVRSGLRDHRCRACWPAFAVLYLEGFVRELLGVRFVVGNSVTIDLGDGAFALCGHLQRGSVCVRPGDRVGAGQQIARCGNSGNSSEPHIHIQVSDHRRPLYAAGLPVVLPALASPERPTGIPRNGEHLDAGGAPPPAERRSGAAPSLRAGLV